MRLVTFILIGLLVLIQIPMWWGHGGWLRVHDLQQQLQAQLQKNADEKARNEHIAGEVQDLRDGTSAIEERARYEMGMMKDGEVFVQFVSPNGAVAAPSGVQPALVTRGATISTPVNVVPNPVSIVPEKKKRHLAHAAQ
jgi:cell division protein FtsB